MRAIVVTMLLLAGCADEMVICGQSVKPYGLLDDDDEVLDHVDYDTVVGNVIWSALTIQTIVLPVYFIGFAIREPSGLKAGHTCEDLAK